MMKSFIYVLKNPNSNTIHYVGKTTQPNIRISGHKNNSKYQRNKIEKWIHSLMILGTFPIMEIIEECTEELVNEREKYWIDFLSRDNELLNNIHCAGNGKKSTKPPRKEHGEVYIKTSEDSTTAKIIKLYESNMDSIRIATILKMKVSIVDFIIEHKDWYEVLR